MPTSRENPLPQIKEALLEYQKKKERRLTLEMVLLSGLNTDASEAKAAADFASYST
jgi:adenine C2-methylase RlmN of 23S rRNA A2503 and tRNA A37